MSVPVGSILADVLQNEIETNKMCFSCGKEFKDAAHLERHKNRKTPCLIRDISEENKKNPLRCIYCNKIFSRLPNLTKHGKTCKIKNGGIDKLHVKVKHEEQTRIKQEESDQKIIAMESKLSLQAAAMETMMKEIEKLKSSVILTPAPNITNNISNVINIHINGYMTPNVDHLLTFEKFNKLFMKEFASLPVALVGDTYFDSNHQENMSIHLINKSTGEMLAMDNDGWKTMSIEDVAMKIREVGYDVAKRGIELHRKDIKFGEADWVCGNIMKNVNHLGATELDIKDIKQKIMESREITGKAPHIAAKLESTRAVGRVRKGINVAHTIEQITNTSDRGDNIAD